MSSTQDHPTKNVAFLGIGTMGAPMAERIAGSNLGFKLHIWNRSTQKATDLEKRSGSSSIKAYSSAIEAIQASDLYVMIMLFDYESIVNTLFPSSDQADHSKALRNKVIVQMSTISVDQNEKLRVLSEQAGAQFLICPVLGTNTVAQAGHLQCLLGATKEQADAIVKDKLLEPLGTVRHIGTVDKAAKMKLTMNFMVGSLTAVLGNALAMVSRNELDMDQFLDIVRNSAFHFKYIEAKAPRMASRDYADPNFTASGMVKDLECIEELAEEQGVNSELIHTLLTLFKKTETDTSSGASGDFAAVYDVFNPTK